VITGEEEREALGEKEGKEMPSRTRVEEEKLEIFNQGIRGELIHHETTNREEIETILLSISSSLSLI
jgi:hypothetical protein